MIIPLTEFGSRQVCRMFIGFSRINGGAERTEGIGYRGMSDGKIGVVDFHLLDLLGCIFKVHFALDILTTARTSRSQKGTGLSGKLQNTKYKLQTSGVLRTYFKRLRRGVLKAFLSPIGLVCNFGHCYLEFVCNLYFVICNFFKFYHFLARFHDKVEKGARQIG